MWTNKTRARYDRSKLRYPSDLTDEEWGLVEPLIPPGKTGGGKRTVIMREVVNGLMYILSTACQWRAIPKDLPPKSSVHDYFDLWTYERHIGANPRCALSTVSRTSAAASQSDRRHHRQPEREKRRKRGACIDPHGYDAGKKIKGKKRHILVDTVGLLLHAIVHPADIQDRDGGVLVMTTLFGMFPFLKKLFVDSGYKGPKFANALAKVRPLIEIEIVKRSDQVSSFVVLPKRWIVERTIAWLNRCRRLAKDWECLNRKALAFLRLASIRLMLRKLCNPA